MAKPKKVGVMVKEGAPRCSSSRSPSAAGSRFFSAPVTRFAALVREEEAAAEEAPQAVDGVAP